MEGKIQFYGQTDRLTLGRIELVSQPNTRNDLFFVLNILKGNVILHYDKTTRVQQSKTIKNLLQTNFQQRTNFNGHSLRSYEKASDSSALL